MTFLITFKTGQELQEQLLPELVLFQALS